MGAWVAMHFARRAPQRVASLSLIGAFASFADNPGVAALEFDVERLGDPVDPDFVREFQQSAGSRDLPNAFFAQVMSESLRMPAYAWKGVLASFSRDGAPPDLSRVTAPVRLFWGERDPFVSRRDQDILLTQAKHASLHVFADAGHAPHWENPKGVADAVAAFTAAAD
jgi:pimeloyl-ACP methyl ester carboxylesterase